MKAALYEHTRGPIVVADVPDPICGPEQVVLRVRATGICRSDWHAWHGHEKVALPHIGGHEYAGVIAQVGSQVMGLAVGDRVCVPFVCGCGRCEYCLAGDAQVCPQQLQPGFDMPGSFAELVAVPAAQANVVPLPDEVGFAAAAALGCRFATAYRAVAAHGQAGPGQWVAVHGCGGVGLSAIMVAVALGAQVVAVDISDDALAKAAQVGAVVTMNGSNELDVGSAVVAATGGGAHISLDALGSAATATNSINSLRRRGRHIQVGLLHGSDVDMALPLARMIGWEIEFIGSHGMAAVDYPGMLALVAAGRLRPQDLITQRITLSDIGRALAAMDSHAPAGITVAELP